MHDAKAHIGEAHTGHVLARGAMPQLFGLAGDGSVQGFSDDPIALRWNISVISRRPLCEAFDRGSARPCRSQRSGPWAWWTSCPDDATSNAVHVDADELVFLLAVSSGDDVVDGDQPRCRRWWAQ